jgi:hypothetical protein
MVSKGDLLLFVENWKGEDWLVNKALRSLNMDLHEYPFEDRDKDYVLTAEEFDKIMRYSYVSMSFEYFSLDLRSIYFSYKRSESIDKIL